MIEVIDDIIPTDLQQQIQDMVLSEYIPWYFNSTTVDLPSFSNNDTFQFIHSIVSGGVTTSEKGLNLVTPLLDQIEARFKLSAPLITRLKFNLLLKRSENPLSHPPHCDIDIKDCKSFVYYIHDTDGDTIFYDKVFKDKPVSYKPNELNIVKRISPKRGSVVVFDSNIYHASSLPTISERRCVLNAVYYPVCDVK